LWQVTVSWHWHGYYEWLVTSHLVLVYSLELHLELLPDINTANKGLGDSVRIKLTDTFLSLDNRNCHLIKQ